MNIIVCIFCLIIMSNQIFANDIEDLDAGKNVSMNNHQTSVSDNKRQIDNLKFGALVGSNLGGVALKGFIIMNHGQKLTNHIPQKS